MGTTNLMGKLWKVLNGVAPVGTLGSFLFYVKKKSYIAASPLITGTRLMKECVGSMKNGAISAPVWRALAGR